jgi:hypothetical protein
MARSNFQHLGQRRETAVNPILLVQYGGGQDAGLHATAVKGDGRTNDFPGLVEQTGLHERLGQCPVQRHAGSVSRQAFETCLRRFDAIAFQSQRPRQAGFCCEQTGVILKRGAKGVGGAAWIVGSKIRTA